ncbi:MAG: hypothetical protein HQK97_01865 [Nitrospirae bacterium]|nr:hypothetical protein [Nitrospirota bacterium]
MASGRHESRIDKIEEFFKPKEQGPIYIISGRAGWSEAETDLCIRFKLENGLRYCCDGHRDECIEEGIHTESPQTIMCET